MVHCVYYNVLSSVVLKLPPLFDDVVLYCRLRKTVLGLIGTVRVGAQVEAEMTKS